MTVRLSALLSVVSLTVLTLMAGLTGNVQTIVVLPIECRWRQPHFEIVSYWTGNQICKLMRPTFKKQQALIRTSITNRKLNALHAISLFLSVINCVLQAQRPYN